MLVAVGVGRNHHKSVVVEWKEIVGEDAFEDFAVAEPEADPEARHFRAGKKSEAFRGGRRLKIANKSDGLDLIVGNDGDIARFGQQFNARRLQIRKGVNIASKGLALVAAEERLLGVEAGKSFLDTNNYVSIT